MFADRLGTGKKQTCCESEILVGAYLSLLQFSFALINVEDIPTRSGKVET